MARIEANVKRVRKSVRDTQGRYALRTRALARKMAAEGRDNVRALIDAKPVGVFPGYAMTGALRRKVVASEPQRAGGGWTALVRVLLTGKQRLYALIHERGGVIRARRVPYLIFYIPRVGWRRAKQVTIQAKHYFRDGIAHTRRTWNINRLRREF